MGASDAPQESSISKAQSIEEIADHWDSHSLADHWDDTQDAQFEVRAPWRHRVVVDPDVYEEIANHARIRGILPETLVNLWLKERLQASR